MNGREFTISSVQYTDPTSANTTGYIQINTTGLGFPDADFNIINTTGPNLQVAYSPSSNVEAFLKGAQNVYEDAPVNFASKKIVLRETGTAKQTFRGILAMREHFQLLTLSLLMERMVQQDKLGLENADRTEETRSGLMN